MHRPITKRLRPYYWVVMYERPYGWTVQFGDYDKSVADQERLDIIDSYPGMSGGLELATRNIKVIKGQDSQSWIDNWLRLNSGD